MEQTLCFTLGQLVDRNSCPRSHDGCNVFLGDLIVDHPFFGTFGAFGLVNLVFNTGNHFVVEAGCVLVTTFTHRSVQFNARIVELSFELPHILQGRFFRRPLALQLF